MMRRAKAHNTADCFIGLLLSTFILLASCSRSGRHVKEEGGEIRFSNGKLEVRVDRSTGRWLALHDLSSGQPVMDKGGNLAPVVLTTGGRTTVTTGRAHLWSIVDTVPAGPAAKLSGWREESTGDTVWLRLDTVDGDWRIRQDYGLKRDGDTLERRVVLTWNGDGETLLRWVDLRTPAVSQAEQSILEAPGYSGILHQPVRRLPQGTWQSLPDRPDGDAPNWRPGLLTVRNGQTNLFVWGFNESVPSMMLVQKGDWGAWFAQKLVAPCRVGKGQSIELGSQYVRLERGDFLAGLKRFQQFWKEAGVSLEGSTPAWARDARIYELHIGQKSFREAPVHQPYPDVHALIRDLPRIASLGFNAIQVMPHFPFPNYSVHDYMDVDTHYAPKADFRRMIDRAHELGLKVLLDVVMHGVVDKTVRPNAPFDLHPWLKEHPEWFSYTEDGRVAKTYTWAFDHADPEFQDYIVRVFTYYVRELNADGFRVDAVTWNFFPNWARGLPRPGYQSISASQKLFARVRAETRKINPDVVFYTESTGPLFYRCFDLSYNYDEHWINWGLLPLLTKRGYAAEMSRKLNAQELAEWLEMRRLALPEGVRRVHHADSHDSHEWGGLGQFRKEAFGVEGARLLFAFSAFLDGGVMNYAGAEQGSEEFYRKVLSLRESTAALREGSCDYTAVRPTSDRVFAPLRRAGDAWALPLLSFSDTAIQTEVPLDAVGLEPETTYTIREAFTGAQRTGKGRELARLSVRLPAYGVQLWMPAAR